jgi:hypothetical protein
MHVTLPYDDGIGGEWIGAYRLKFRNLMALTDTGKRITAFWRHGLFDLLFINTKGE